MRRVDRLPEGLEAPLTVRPVLPGREQVRVVRPANRRPHPVTGRMVMLTTAHVYDKRPCNCKLLNLAALCNRCHFGWDRPRKLAPERLWKLQEYTRKTKRKTPDEQGRGRDRRSLLRKEGAL